MFCRHNLAALLLLSSFAVAEPTLTNDVDRASAEPANAAITAPIAAPASSAESSAPAAVYPSAFTTKPVPKAENSGVGSAVMTTDPVSVAVVLLLIVALIIAGAWFMRRIGVVPAMGGQAMKVVSVLSVGTREKVVLIDVGGQQVLVGVAPGRVSHLQSFEQPVVTTSAVSNNDFSTTMKNLLKKNTSSINKPATRQ